MPTTNDGEITFWFSAKNSFKFQVFTFKFSAKITHTLGMLTPVDFHSDRSCGRVVLRWKSPDVMVDCEFRWKSPDIMVMWVRV